MNHMQTLPFSVAKTMPKISYKLPRALFLEALNTLKAHCMCAYPAYRYPFHLEEEPADIDIDRLRHWLVVGLAWWQCTLHQPQSSPQSNAQLQWLPIV